MKHIRVVRHPLLYHNDFGASRSCPALADTIGTFARLTAGALWLVRAADRAARGSGARFKLETLTTNH